MAAVIREVLRRRRTRLRRRRSRASTIAAARYGSLVSSLKECTKQKDLCEGTRLHTDICRRGLLAKSSLLGTPLVFMYAKCGALLRAQEVLQELRVRDVGSWSALITGYTQQGQGKEALECYQRMQSEGIFPNAVAYAFILKACAITQNIDRGQEIHDEIASQMLLDKNPGLGGALVNMYAKCGAREKAQLVFDELIVRNLVSWSVLIAGYAQQGLGEDALRCFYRMQSEGTSPNTITYVSTLKACGITRLLDKAKQIHLEIISQGPLENDAVLGSPLVDMYAKCGALTRAQQVIDELPIRDASSWTALISGYTQQGQGKGAIDRFYQMQSEGVSPNAITYACVLKACGMTKEFNRGKQIHDDIVSQGLLGDDIVLGNALIDMYAKCGVLTRAKQLLNELPVCDIVSWNSLITAYVQEGQGMKAIECYDQLQCEGLWPNAITYAYVLKACGITRDVDRGKQIHHKIFSHGFLRENVALCNALVDMYAKCGALVKARQFFNQLALRDVVSWTALMAGYVQEGLGKEAIDCFYLMRQDGISPNMVTYLCTLKACGITKEIDLGKKIHDEILNRGLVGKDVTLDNALIDMYAKCGALTRAQEVLGSLPIRNLGAWNSIILGYAQQGQGEQARDCMSKVRRDGFTPDLFSWNALMEGHAQMAEGEEALGCFAWALQEGIPPDVFTFICVLNACSHSGLVDEGQMFFINMVNIHCVRPTLGHHMCLIDLLGRAGRFDKAMVVVNEMPPPDHHRIWFGLLGSYHAWRDLDLGKLIFKHAVQISACDAATYVCMDNTHVAAGMGEE